MRNAANVSPRVAVFLRVANEASQVEIIQAQKFAEQQQQPAARVEPARDWNDESSSESESEESEDEEDSDESDWVR